VIASEVLREIRTPVASIEGAAFILADTNEADNPGEFLEIIRTECDRLKRAMADISDCTESLPLRCEPADVASLLAEIVHLSALEHPDPNIVLRTEVASSLPPVWCDVTRIRQAIVPFVTSTMDSMLSGGRILLAADRVDGHCRIQLKILEQTVRASDPGSGCGPYSSTSDPTAGHRNMASWRTVMQHGGTIRVEENGQTGKLQFLTLPLYNGERA
jgi:signal transduction histidine kinase